MKQSIPFQKVPINRTRVNTLKAVTNAPMAASPSKIAVLSGPIRAPINVAA